MPPAKRGSRKTQGTKTKVVAKPKTSAKNKPVRKSSSKKVVAKRRSSISYIKKQLDGVRVYKKAGELMDGYWNTHPNLTKGQRMFIFNVLNILMVLQGTKSVTEKTMRTALSITDQTSGLRTIKK